MKYHQWHNNRALTVVLPVMDGTAASGSEAFAIMINADDEDLEFSLPAMQRTGAWKLVFHSGQLKSPQLNEQQWVLPLRSIACALYKHD
jgi:hypothetical protein